MMIQSIVSTCFAFLLALSTSASGPILNHGQASQPAYRVTLSVNLEAGTVSGYAELASHSGALQISFPDRYASTTLEPRLSGELTASREGATLELERTSPFRWQLKPTLSGTTDPIELDWTIRLDHREQPQVIAGHDTYEHPYLGESSGMLFTAALVPMPEVDDLQIEVRIQAPEGWSVHAPWPELESDAPGSTFAPDYAGLRNDIVLLGEWRSQSVEADGLTATFAFAPGQEWLEPLVQEQLIPIVEAEIELFGGAPQPKYLFVFGNADGFRGYGGSPKTNAMTLSVSKDLNPERLTSDVSHLIAHEFHHTWMRARCHPVDDLRFVAEGFTDYFAYVVSWRLEHLSDEAFKQALEQNIAKGSSALASYCKPSESNENGSSLARAGGPDFFLGGDAYNACYASGLTLALLTDLALRSDSTPDAEPRTLDQFMRGFYEAETWRDGTQPTLEHWNTMLIQWLGEQRASALITAAESKTGYNPVELFKTIGMPLKASTESAGSTPRANMEGTTITGLDPAGPAGLAGLQVGDRLLTVNGVQVQSVRDVHVAWREPVDGKLALDFERGGKQEQLHVPVPTRTRFELPAEAIQLLNR